jgi:hypothetical protein
MRTRKAVPLVLAKDERDRQGDGDKDAARGYHCQGHITGGLSLGAGKL